jgi:hypothetical protein
VLDCNGSGFRHPFLVENRLSYQPSLAQDLVLKADPAFAAARVKLLGTSMPASTKLDLLLDDNHLSALAALLEKYPTPEHALRVEHLFAQPCRDIFRKATLT